MTVRLPAAMSALALVALGFAVATSSADAQSGPRTVDCRIESTGSPTVSGKCRFNADSDGSFSLESTDVRRSVSGPIRIVTVTMVKPGVAEVRGLTKDGINSRWGEARRSRSDKGCWQGSDFKVCAW